MKRTLGLALLTLSGLTLSACSSVVCDDDACCESDTCDPPPPPGTSGVAVPWEAFEGTRGPAAPGTLVLKLTNGDGFCQSPWLDGVDCAGGWEVDIPLPPSLQIPGAKANLADLADLGGGATFKDSGPGEGDSCQLEEGALDGELEVVSIDGTWVTVRLTGVSMSLDDLEEEITLLRCQNADLPQQAVAVTASRLASIYPELDAAGLEEEPATPSEPLHLFIDLTDPSLGAVCEDPLGAMSSCEERLTLEIAIGGYNQLPGTFALEPFDDVGQGMSVTTYRASAGEVCLSEAEPWTEGTVEIIAFSQALVQVRATAGDGSVVDAVATVCP